MAKKIIAWLLVVVLTAGAAIGGTLAYLTDRDSEANVFTVGDVKIDLEEDFDQGAELIPGVDVEKKPTITNVGINDAWVWATVAVPEKLASVIEFTGKGEGWAEWTEAAESVEIEGKRYTLYTALYNEALSTGDVTTALFDTVTLDKTVDIDPDGQWHTVVNGTAADLGWNNSDGNPVIYVSAYAIQTEGFGTVEEAYAAYQTQWGDNGDEYDKPPKYVMSFEEMAEVCKTGGEMILGRDLVYTAEDTVEMISGSILLINGKNVSLDMNGHSITISEEASKISGALFFIGNPGGHLNITGEGEFTVENGKAVTVWTLQSGTANVYSGTFESNSVKSEAMFYSQGNGGVINIYGGKYIFDVSNTLNGGFNVSDNAGSNLRIILHEGVLLNRPEYGQHLQGVSNGEGARIQLAEGCELVETVIDGETWYKVTKQ